ncbi:hypothetical protein CEV34_5325 [Brucella pseudogrignonensis]|uniref:Uncharacterized protein n=1 Tax=Brucella pseudogrignonensis TaxID=419475 RepID=A0A256G1H9_9HYPH|nr:hypothetical protein CEV34_5325 [Brucella pseudogrignonensis]
MPGGAGFSIRDQVWAALLCGAKTLITTLKPLNRIRSEWKQFGTFRGKQILESYGFR